MNVHACAALLACLALLALPGSAPARRRFGRTPRRTTRERSWLPLLAALAGTAGGELLGGSVTALLGALAGAVLAEWLRRRVAARRRRVSPLRLAAAWDLLAACLRGGLGVPGAVTVIAGELPERLAVPLRRCADLTALGAPPEQAWAPVLEREDTEPLGRGALRSARSGAALADVAEALARRARDSADDAAESAAGRAGVLVSGPLGCCFLPAFLCLGVVPVVVGLASGMLDSW